MKILQVMAGNEHGGAESAFVDLCVAMRDAGVDIEVATRPNALRVSQLEAAGLKVHTLPFGGPVDVFTSWKLARIIKAFSPTIVQTWMARGAKKTPRWSKSMGIPRYLVVSRLGGYYKLKYFSSADYFTTNTPDLKSYLVGQGVPAGKVRVVTNFADCEDTSPAVCKEDLGTPAEAPVVLALARLHSVKGLDLLIQAARVLPSIYVWLAGEGPLREELEQLAHELGVADRVKFLGWRTDRLSLLRACDICAIPSRVEPFGGVFIQAWSQRTPVVVSDSDGPRQFCHHEEDCLMVPRDDTHALVQSIGRLLEDKALVEKVTENGYQRFLAEFTKERTVSAYLEYFLDILARERILIAADVVVGSRDRE